MEGYVLEIVNFFAFALVALDTLITAFLLKFTWTYADAEPPRKCLTLHISCGILTIVSGITFFLIGPIYIW